MSGYEFGMLLRECWAAACACAGWLLRLAAVTAVLLAPAALEAAFDAWCNDSLPPVQEFPMGGQGR